jgi:hypothetical protein
MNTKISILILASSLMSCNFSKSVKIDLISGLSTTGNMISCSDVFLTVNDQKVSSNTFLYGQEFFLNFNNVEGLKNENGKVFPGMEIEVLNKSGDTLLQAKDLYSANNEGVSISPLMLRADITAASPIHSQGDYTLYVKIWDKKDKGTFNAKYSFKVEPNSAIKIEPNDVTFREIYLFSKENGKVNTNNRVKANEKVYLIFEGLSGLKAEGEKVFPGLSIKATENGGDVVLNEEDLFDDRTATGVSASDFATQVYSNINFTTSEIKSPVHCEVTIWDKKSKAKITASFDLTVEK